MKLNYICMLHSGCHLGNIPHEMSMCMLFAKNH